MSDDYDAVADRYCYAGTTVLKNRLGLRDPDELEEFETASVFLRSGEALPRGRFTPAHYRALHRHHFQDVYRWAGHYRTVRISKEASLFCYPENIRAQMRQLFAGLAANNRLRGRDAEGFVEGAAEFLAYLNAIHPFREGNGRTQLAFVAELAAQAGHPLDMSQLDPGGFMTAMIISFHGDEAPLRAHLAVLVGA